MQKSIEINSHVNEQEFIIHIRAMPSTHTILITGAYDEYVYLNGLDTLLTEEVISAFSLQPEIKNIQVTWQDNWAFLILEMKEGSNFFELDFSVLNRTLDNTEHSHFRW